MEKLQWHFPKDLDEAAGLLGKKGVVPHAGGTALIRRGVDGLRGFVDLGGLGLGHFKAADGSVEIGAMQTYEDVRRNMAGVDSQSILIAALGFLPPQLRNRITVGGSVAAFPTWSDIIGPLIALDAKVNIGGKNGGSYGIVEFVKNASLKDGGIITSVRFESKGWKSHYFRADRTSFDYSAFNLSFLVRGEKGKIEDARVVVVGCKDRFRRLSQVEDGLEGRASKDIDVAGLVKGVDIEFNPKKLGSPAYLSHLARVELERGLEKILRGS